MNERYRSNERGINETIVIPLSYYIIHVRTTGIKATRSLSEELDLKREIRDHAYQGVSWKNLALDLRFATTVWNDENGKK